MANVLPEVRPSVESMPHEGFVMQTGGSARRTFIKNDGSDTYHVHGVPGHTHNASAMISVTADYTATRDVGLTIHETWAEEKFNTGVDDFTDSVEPDDAEQLYDRAIERGIGKITLIPENCQHMIQEPVRSISEIRTIVSAKDRRDTLTYVNNEYGWVDPATGELSTTFNRTEAVQINVFGYPSPLQDLYAVAQPNVALVGGPTMRQPVYIGNRGNELYRYSITSKGSDTPAGLADWDGNIPFFWDDDTRSYRSQEFSKYFTAALVQTQNSADIAVVGRGPTVNQTRQVISTNHAAVGGQAGFHIGDVTINAATIPVTGAGAFKVDSLQIPPLHPVIVPIPQANFKVTFAAYSTYPAQDGYCVFSRQPNECIYRDDLEPVYTIVANAAPPAVNALVGREGIGFSLVPDMPVEVHFADNKITDQPFWFGCPAYRIAVGGKFALPGPIRDKAFSSENGGGVPGNYDDAQVSYFTQVSEHNNVDMSSRTFWYGEQFKVLLTPEIIDPGGGQPAIRGTLDSTRRTMDLNVDNADAYNVLGEEVRNLHAAIHGQAQRPVNEIAAVLPILWSTVVSNFDSAPYMFLRYTLNRPFGFPNATHPNAQEYFRRGIMDHRRVGVGGMEETFKFEESPYLRNMYYPSDRPSHTPKYTCDGRVNRPWLRNPAHRLGLANGGVVVNGPPHNILIRSNPYNQLVAAPLLTYMFTSLIAARWGYDHANSQQVGAGAGIANIVPDNWAAMDAVQQLHFLGGHKTVKSRHKHLTRLQLTIPTACHAGLFRKINPAGGAVALGGAEVRFDADAHNIALDMWRRHYTEWVRRALYSFGQNDAFVPAFDHPAGAANGFFSPDFQALEKVDHTGGGYRLYSANARVNYKATLTVVDEAVAGPAVPPADVPTEYFTYLMDHVHMREITVGATVQNLELGFEGDSTPLETDVLPAHLVGGVAHVQAGYGPLAHYLGDIELKGPLDEEKEWAVRAGNADYAYSETTAVNVPADVGFDTVTTVPAVPGVFTSRTQGNYLYRREELGNYFIVNLVAAAASQFARTDPGNTGGFTHIEFRNFYWNYTDNRPMYLLFNNYGVEREHTSNEAIWANVDRPTAIAFFFNSQDAEPIIHTGVGPLYEVRMRIPYGKLVAQDGIGGLTYFVDGAPLHLTAKINCAWHGATEHLVQQGRHADGATALAANSEIELTQASPSMCLFVPGRKYAAEFLNSNYASVMAESMSRGLVHRVKNRISQHLCAPILNPDTRLGCIAPLNHDTRHLPPEMRDFTLMMSDVSFDFLQTTETATLNDIVLSEFNGGIQQVATSESLLYLPNFKEFKTTVAEDLTFSADCYSSDGVPAFVCAFCRTGPVLDDQPLIIELSFQNRTTMKKSDTIYNTSIHELFHMTQRNVHNRSEYGHAAFNKRQTILLATEDIGIMGMDPADNYQSQKRVIIRVSGRCTTTGDVTIMYVYNNRGLYLTGVQQSVVRL